MLSGAMGSAAGSIRLTVPPTRIRAIVVDFGGVLIDWNPRYLYRKLFPGNETAMESFLAEIGFTEWNRQQDAGRTFSHAVTELVKRFPSYADLIQAYDERWKKSPLQRGRWYSSRFDSSRQINSAENYTSVGYCRSERFMCRGLAGSIR